jgi:hypothetical protein
MNRELPLINAKQRRDKDLVLPVVLENCLWECIVGSVLASPRDARMSLRPLKDWRPMRKGVEAVTFELAAAIRAHFSLKEKPLFEWNV